nr:hypothetical protein CFP56_18743 [Quercus suber]
MKLAGVWSESAPGFFVLRRRCCSSGSGIGAWVLRPSPSVLLVWVWNRRLGSSSFAVGVARLGLESTPGDRRRSSVLVSGWVHRRSSAAGFVSSSLLVCLLRRSSAAGSSVTQLKLS